MKDCRSHIAITESIHIYLQEQCELDMKETEILFFLIVVVMIRSRKTGSTTMVNVGYQLNLMHIREKVLEAYLCVQILLLHLFELLKTSRY